MAFTRNLFDWHHHDSRVLHDVSEWASVCVCVCLCRLRNNYCDTSPATIDSGVVLRCSARSKHSKHCWFLAFCPESLSNERDIEEKKVLERRKKLYRNYREYAGRRWSTWTIDSIWIRTFGILSFLRMLKFVHFHVSLGKPNKWVSDWLILTQWLTDIF